ncbi:D-alanyl-D-alanine carboxypeptidase/D-alanyl-D-alanine endopeptidase [Oceanobacillus sp. CAU 1775]
MNSKTAIRLLILFLLIGFVMFFTSFVEDEPLVLEASNEKDPNSITENTSSLEDKIYTILEKEELNGAIVGITVKDAQHGELIFSHNNDIRLHPASNMKLLTGIAALETLGPEYRFRTEILTDGKVVGNTLSGNLYIKGKGDPTLLKTALKKIASDLKAQGIQVIQGNLIADDEWYDDVRLSQDLNWSDESFYTGAQITALTLSPNEDYDAGTVIVEVAPTDSTNGKAHIRTIPKTDYVTIINRTELVGIGEAKDISIEREHGTNNIIVEGQMPKDGSLSRSLVSVWEPTGYALSVFRDALTEEGIQFTADSQDVFHTTPKTAELLAIRESAPLSDLLLPFMKLSNNGIGEVLTKEMGKQINMEGSWEQGLLVIEDVLAELGVRREDILLRDGSGMSHKTLISTDNIAELLFQVQEKDWFDVFKTSLPVAGEEERLIGGTLRHRLTTPPTQGNAFAKTGMITGVSTLSGYLNTKNGEELIFSVLINNHLESSNRMQEMIDELVIVLVENDK